MRIAMVGPFGLEHRGTMKVRALPIARALAERGHKVLVVMPPWHDRSLAPRHWVEDGVSLEYVVVRPRIPVLRELATTGRMLRVIRAWNPDVVHTFKPKAFSGLVGWFLWHFRGKRPRLVVDEDDWEGAGGWNDVSGYSAVEKAFFAWQERWGLLHSDSVTVASRALQTLSWAQGCAPHRVYYVPNGAIPRTRGDRSFAKRRYDLEDHTVVLLYTRFFEFDPARVVRMLSTLVRQRPDVILLVVGQALDPADDERFDSLIASQGLEKHVVRTGWVDASLLPDLYAAADVAWFPFDDTLINRTKCSVKLVDLLASGVPTVADAVGQNVEYIKSGESGILVDTCDEDAMVGATLQLIQDPDRAGLMAHAAVQDMKGRFAWKELVDRVVAAYSD